MNIDSPGFAHGPWLARPEDARRHARLHNETAGSPQGIAAARALGDLSHKVYSPITKAGGTEENELLFIDYWMSPQGIGQFFSNAHVQEQGSKLFSKRDPVVWMPAKGAFSFNLPAAQGKNDRWLGVVRGVVKSPEAAIDAFAKALSPTMLQARARGQLSHEIYFRIPMPGENLPPGDDRHRRVVRRQRHARALQGAERPRRRVRRKAGDVGVGASDRRLQRVVTCGARALRLTIRACEPNGFRSARVRARRRCTTRGRARSPRRWSTSRSARASPPSSSATRSRAAAASSRRTSNHAGPRADGHRHRARRARSTRTSATAP